MKKKKLIVRSSNHNDIPQITKLVAKAYPNIVGYSEEMLRAQMTHYPEGHFVAVMNNTVVGYSASIRISERRALKSHSWKEITGGGFGSTHEPDGDFLYGYETCVDPDFRRHRIGQRFYNYRKNLVKFERLKGIVFGGRVPNFKKKRSKVKDIFEYIELVKNKKIMDPTLGFQIRNGFEVIGVLENYIPSDKESGGLAVHLLWKNPEIIESTDTKKEKSLLKKTELCQSRLGSISTARYQVIFRVCTNGRVFC